MSKALTVWFSASHQTEKLAKTIAAASGSDLYEIKPAVPYTAADLDWRNSKSRSSLEMKDPASRPEMIQDTPDLSLYNTIFVGFPIWWYTAPHIILTFLENNDLSGKTIIPFATSGGSGIDGSAKDLQKACPHAGFKAGRKMSAGESLESVQKWIGSLGLQ
ncbi:MAG: flavodoxin [Erysipelotrichaceae bacterium]|nr:flavodoxin [Erysipelotrichaceae bacterium]